MHEGSPNPHTSTHIETSVSDKPVYTSGCETAIRVSNNDDLSAVNQLTPQSEDAMMILPAVEPEIPSSPLLSGAERKTALDYGSSLNKVVK